MTTLSSLSLAQVLLLLAFGLVTAFIGAVIQQWVTARQIRRKIDAFVELLEGKAQPH